MVNIPVRSRNKYNKQSHRGDDPYYQSSKHRSLRTQALQQSKGFCQGCKTEKGIIHLAGKYATAHHIISWNYTNIGQAINHLEWMKKGGTT